MIELIFISGPLLTAAIAAVTSPAGALIVSAVAVDRRHRDLHRAAADAPRRARARSGTERPARRARLARRAHAGARSRCRRASGSACSRSASRPSAAPRAPRPRRACCWRSGRSAAASAACSTARSRAARACYRTHLLVAALLPLTLLPLAAAPSVWVMALLVIPAGCCIAPLLATRNELVGGVAPPGMRTEAYTWPITSFVGGIAIGAALCGRARRGPGLADGVRRRRRLRRRRRAAGRAVAPDRVPVAV